MLEGGALQGLFEVIKYPVTLLRSAGLGVVMGLLPGVGEFGSQFFSYTLAQRFSKPPELFGKGAPEGIIASETSNNAVTATVMVPLLSLGIPADALMAMMLAVFMVHNYIPGPALFERHPEFISGLYIALFMMNIIVFCYLLIATRWIVKLTQIRARFIGAMIMVLGFIGSYTQNYRFADALLALGFAGLGLVLRRANVPAVPIVLGLVLGPVFVGRFRQAMGTASGDLTIFVTRPISLILVALIVLSIAGFAWSQRAKPQASEPIQP